MPAIAASVRIESNTFEQSIQHTYSLLRYISQVIFTLRKAGLAGREDNFGCVLTASAIFKIVSAAV